MLRQQSDAHSQKGIGLVRSQCQEIAVRAQCLVIAVDKKQKIPSAEVLSYRWVEFILVKIRLSTRGQPMCWVGWLDRSAAWCRDARKCFQPSYLDNVPVGRSQNKTPSNSASATEEEDPIKVLRAGYRCHIAKRGRGEAGKSAANVTDWVGLRSVRSLTVVNSERATFVVDI
jgi:hypothetical protein